MNRRLFVVLSAGFLLLALAIIAADSNAATCKWRNIAIGCNGDCVQIAFQNPAGSCPGSTVDVQRRDCTGGAWTTIATNVTSPVNVSCDTPGVGYDYRLVVNCSCGGVMDSGPLGCTTCP